MKRQRDLVDLMFDPATLQSGFNGLLADHRDRRPSVSPTRTHQPGDRPKKRKRK
jgi:hypothetical protein